MITAKAVDSKRAKGTTAKRRKERGAASDWEKREEEKNKHRQQVRAEQPEKSSRPGIVKCKKSVREGEGESKGEMVVASGTNAYAKEMTIRKRIANIFNKREDDFPSLKDYNDYLEEVEDMTFNLVEGIDVAAIEAKIANYQEENAEQIINAQARKAEELAAALKASKGNPVQAETTDGAAGQSLQAGGVHGQYAPAVAGAAFTQPRPTGMMPHVQPGPVGGGSETQGSLGFDEETQNLRAERGARAGGWTVELSKRRAFEEAFGSMWI